jgi:hypothetical protein
MRCADHVARTGEKITVWFWLENQKEDLDVDGRLLRWILGTYGGVVWTGFIWLRIWTSGGLL